MVVSVELKEVDLFTAVRGIMPDSQIVEIVNRKGKIARRVHSYPFAINYTTVCALRYNHVASCCFPGIMRLWHWPIVHMLSKLISGNQYIRLVKYVFTFRVPPLFACCP